MLFWRPAFLLRGWARKRECIVVATMTAEGSFVLFFSCEFRVFFAAMVAGDVVDCRRSGMSVARVEALQASMTPSWRNAGVAIDSL